MQGDVDVVFICCICEGGAHFWYFLKQDWDYINPYVIEQKPTPKISRDRNSFS